MSIQIFILQMIIKILIMLVGLILFIYILSTVFLIVTHDLEILDWEDRMKDGGLG